jgi:hypothetical protein
MNEEFLTQRRKDAKTQKIQRAQFYLCVFAPLRLKIF